MKCEKCGAELQQKDDKLVCPNCGAEYVEQAQPATETASEYITPRGFSSKKNIIIIILTAILVLGLGAGITAIAVTNSPSFRVSQGIDLAERYLSEQNYEQAIIEYEKVLEIEPMNVDAYLGLAKVYEKMGDIDKAIEILREGLKMTGDERIEKRLNKLVNPEDNSSSSAPDESSIPEESTPEDLPPYGSMGSVTIQGVEYDIATTTELKLEQSGITNDDIVQIGKLVNLTYLDLWDNRISDITPLSNLTNLARLALNYNQISDISPLANLTNLTYLELCENQISDIKPLANLTNLTNLNLINNQISDITPLANLTNLTDLWLDNNQISDISPLTKLTNLTWLDLDHNQISDISPLANLTNLTDLWLGYNQITEENKTWLKQQLPNCSIVY